MNHSELSLQVSKSSTTMPIEVVHAGTGSNSHIKVANTKMAITRCSTSVRSGMPNAVVGKNNIKKVQLMMKISLTVVTERRYLKLLRSLRSRFHA